MEQHDSATGSAARDSDVCDSSIVEPIHRLDRPCLVHVTTVPMSLTFLKGQVDLMRDRGFRVHAISSWGEELFAFGEQHKVTVHPVEMKRSVSPAHDLLAVWKITTILRSIRPRIVHAHTPKGGLLGMIAARAARVPVRLYHMRGLPLMGAKRPKRDLLWLTERISCRLAHSVLCNSHSLREIAIDEGICPPEKISVPRNGSGQGVDGISRFNPMRFDIPSREQVRLSLGIPAGATVLGFVGRIVRDKGMLELGEAWQELRENYHSLHLLLVGPLEDQDPIPDSLLERWENDPRVHMVGLDWNTPPLYSIMDVLVLPTYREGFPNVLLEAAAMAVPVVATRIPGCIDAVEDRATGLLVPPRDSRALASAIRTYLSDPDTGHRHGSAARARVLREFRQEDIWEAIYQEYCRLLNATS